MKLQMRSIRKKIIPRPLQNVIVRKILVPRMRKANKKSSVKDVFTKIYTNNEWGGEAGQYFSGRGSSEYLASFYADMIKPFIREKQIPTVIDLGCGDFAVGSKIQTDEVKYIGVDVVDNLVICNQQLYGSPNTSFECLDITVDNLPEGDLCLIRQVLQHLSNSQIKAVLQKIKKYKYAIITEHYPASSIKVIPNRDKVYGADTRVYDNSAVYLDQPPFNIQGLSLLLEVYPEEPLVEKGETIRSFLIQNEV